METGATPTITLGQSGIITAPPGVGTWTWGEERFWGYGQGYGHDDVAAGVTLFDTAEIDGRGESGRIVGELARGSAVSALIATKFAPLPWRLSTRAARGALDLLRRIGEDHGGKSPAQVALNWPTQQEGVVPLPGAKTGSQATGNAGALGWALRPAEVETLAMAFAR